MSVPTASDDVVIAVNGGTTVMLDNGGTAACHSLTIGGGVSSANTVTIGVSGGCTLTIGTTLTMNNLGTLNLGINGILIGGGVAVNSGSTLTVGSGTLTSSTSVNTGGTLVLAGGIINCPTLVIGSVGVFNITNGGTISGTTVNSSGDTTFSGTSDVDFDAGVAFNNLSGAIFNATASQHMTSSAGSSTFVNDGIFDANGASPCAIDNGISFTNNGTLIVTNISDQLNIHVLTNYSGSTLTGGSYTLNGNLQLNGVTGFITTNAADISLAGSSAVITDSASNPMLNGLANNSASGTLILAGGAAITTTGAVANSGSIALSGPGTALMASGSYTQSSGTTTLDSNAQLSDVGSINLQGGSLLVTSSAGLSNPVNNSGAQIVALAGQTLSINGAYTQSGTGSFTSDITSPTQVGKIAVTGAATLTGSVTAGVAYSPALGDTFQVMTFTSHSGQFSSLLPASLPGSLSLNQVVTGTSISLQTVAGTGPAVLPPIINSVAASLPTTETGVAVSFTASATDPQSLPLTYTWDFGDSSPHMTGSSVTHAFTSESAFIVTLTVSNGSLSSSATLLVITFAPNVGGQGITNISQGVVDIIDPISNLGISVMTSDGGVIQLQIDVGSLRDTVNVSTSFAGIGTRTSPVSGLSPVNKFTAPGVFIADAMATDPATGAAKGHGRLQAVGDHPSAEESRNFKSETDRQVCIQVDDRRQPAAAGRCRRRCGHDGRHV